MCIMLRSVCFFFSSRRRHTRLQGDWSSDVCSSDLPEGQSRPGFIGRNNYYLGELGVAILYPNIRGSAGYGKTFVTRSEERRVGKSVDLGGRRIIKKKKRKTQMSIDCAAE